MGDWRYTKGLHEIGNGLYAYLQPDGGWGWSNSGLIVDGESTLLVDTLFDMSMTEEMLKLMEQVTGVSAQDINTIVNTHANGDHTYGNACCPRAEIIASDASAAEMREITPSMLAQIMSVASELGDTGTYLSEIFGCFDFAGVQERLPTKTFSGALQLYVETKIVELIEVGPAHTSGDVLVWIPESRTVYTGDILFIESTPIVWEGSVSNWIIACDRILALNPEVIVPGHGPIADEEGVRRVQEYLKFLDFEVRSRFDAGLSVRDTIFDIALGHFSSWRDSERLAANTIALYREYAGEGARKIDILEIFGLMAELRKKL